MTRRVGWIALAAGAATAILLATDLVPGIRGPVNWRWGSRVLPEPGRVLLVIALWGAIAAVAAALARRCSLPARTAWLAAAVVLVFAQMVALTAVEPGGLSNVPRRVMDPSFTSYHTIAADVDDPAGFLARYHRLQPRLAVHGPSQPPGRVLFFWSVNRWASAPGRAERLLAFGERVGGVPAGPRGTTDAERAGALVAGFLLMGLGAFCVVPVAVLARPLVPAGRASPGQRAADDSDITRASGIDPPATRRAMAASVLLFGSLPSLLLFTPQTDHLILLASLGSAALLAGALRLAGTPGALGFGFLAGLVAGAGVFVSFTTLAALFAWGVAFLGWIVHGALRGEAPVAPSRLALLGVAGALGFAVVPAWTGSVGLDWPEVFREATAAAHRVQVLIHGREYSTWVFANLWDFVLFLGPGLGVAWLARAGGEARELRFLHVAREEPLEIPFALALLVSLLVLDLSGRILGEVGRIWMFLMPLAILAAARSPLAQSPRALAPLAVAQLVVLLALRAFVNVPG